MIKALPWMLMLILPAVLAPLARAGEAERLYDIAEGRALSLDQLVPTLRENRIVIVGEQHTNVRHHQMQLAVIRALHETGAAVAVGMEMFRSDSRPHLAAWTAGRLAEKDFIRIFQDNWDNHWEMYASILRYARDNRLPVVGLNVSAEITDQVARRGFDSLSEEQRGKLENITCRVDKTYMAFIKRAYGAHVHGRMNFTHFCEAQLVWDNIMAINALTYIQANPGTILVVITGNGHAWKGGIPTRIAARSDVPVCVILPEIPGITEPGMVDTHDADYLFLE
jgi:uncharacterized iron-regulated protein